jgi:opacity protein-like surface antigen
MKRVMLVAVLLLSISAIAAAADDFPKAEVFGGYSFVRCNPGYTNDTSCNLNGWNASVAFNANKGFGFVADFGGAYGSVEPYAGYNVDLKIHSFLFGPKVAMRTEKITPFAQALFGVSHTKYSDDDNTYADFTMALGGGLDLNVHKNMAVRLAQAEYITTQVSGVRFNHFRYSAGVVFQLGK